MVLCFVESNLIPVPILRPKGLLQNYKITLWVLRTVCSNKSISGTVGYGIFFWRCFLMSIVIKGAQYGVGFLWLTAKNMAF